MFRDFVRKRVLKVVNNVVHISLKLPTRRTKVILCDGIFDPELDCFDSLTLFSFLRKERKQIQAYYIVHKKNKNAKELIRVYGKNIIIFDGSYIRLLIKIIPHLINLRVWCDGYFLLTGYLKMLGVGIFHSKRVISINAQHGVNCFKFGDWEKKNLQRGIYKYAVVSTWSEKTLFMKYLGYKDDQLLCTGLSRWAEPWREANSKIILIYFTWRESMINKKSTKRAMDYFSRMSLLINSDRFSQALENCGYSAFLAMHHSSEEYGCENTIKIKNSNVKLISQDELSAIKKDVKLLITDYSSLAFDFMKHDRLALFVNLGDEIKNSRDRISRSNAEEVLKNLPIAFQTIDEFLENFEEILKLKNFEVPEKFSEDYFPIRGRDILIRQSDFIENQIHQL